MKYEAVGCDFKRWRSLKEIAQKTNIESTTNKSATPRNTKIFETSQNKMISTSEEWREKSNYIFLFISPHNLKTEEIYSPHMKKRYDL